MRVEYREEMKRKRKRGNRKETIKEGCEKGEREDEDERINCMEKRIEQERGEIRIGMRIETKEGEDVERREQKREQE